MPMASSTIQTTEPILKICKKHLFWVNGDAKLHNMNIDKD